MRTIRGDTVFGRFEERKVEAGCGRYEEIRVRRGEPNFGRFEMMDWTDEV